MTQAPQPTTRMRGTHELLVSEVEGEGIEAAAENVFRRRERNFFGRGEEQAAAGRLKNNAAAAAAALFYADDV